MQEPSDALGLLTMDAMGLSFISLLRALGAVGKGMRHHTSCQSKHLHMLVAQLDRETLKPISFQGE